MASPGSSGTAQTSMISSSGSRQSSMGSNETTEPISLTIGLLQKITDNFSEKLALGQGAYGKVFKGVHDNGEEIAVKLLHNNMQAIDDGLFQQEFDNLMMLNHPNIIRLVGYCYETQRQHMEFQGKIIFGERTYKALCFEYMHKGSLQKHIHDESHGLDWERRYKIIKGICEGLNYLHEGCKEPIYHLDLKPDNILLDEYMVPKLADFGLSKLFGEEQTRVTQCPLGTIGYMPPEYLFRNIVSKKVDIFSLGVVMIKIIAGPRGHSRSDEMPYQEFLDLVQENWRNRMEMTPSHSRPLEGYCQQVNICTKIALSCMETDRHKRPSIVHIIDKLNDTETVIDEAVSWSESMRSWMHGDLVNVQAFPRSEAIPCAQRCKGFPVLVQVTGAQWHGEEEMPRPGVDLVVLLDLDMTMALQRGLSIVKQALMVVIDKLGTKDRLSIVSYEENAPHSMKLTYMSEQGRNAARLMVNELGGNHGNDIIVGLREGAKILRGREDEEGDSRVGCIMFLLDSSDMSVYDNYHEEFSSEFATYTFGLGDKHNPSLLKFVADMTGGTYSIVHYHINEMKNAFELLLSGLTKIAATSVKIKLRAHERVAISSIYSGGHDSRVSPDKVSGEINIKDIYTRERKNFIVYLTVPNGNNNMKLLTVSGQYKSFIAGRRLPHMDVFVLRPGSTCLPEELAIHREVAAEMVRMQLRNDVLYMNTNQPYEVNLIWNRIKSSEEGRGAPEETLLELGNQVDEIGRSLMYCSAYRLSWLTCHKWQRGTTIWASPVPTFTTPQQHEDGKKEQDNPTDRLLVNA